MAERDRPVSSVTRVGDHDDHQRAGQTGLADHHSRAQEEDEAEDGQDVGREDAGEGAEATLAGLSLGGRGGCRGDGRLSGHDKHAMIGSMTSGTSLARTKERADDSAARKAGMVGRRHRRRGDGPGRERRRAARDRRGRGRRRAGGRGVARAGRHQRAHAGRHAPGLGGGDQRRHDAPEPAALHRRGAHRARPGSRDPRRRLPVPGRAAAVEGLLPRRWRRCTVGPALTRRSMATSSS